MKKIAAVLLVALAGCASPADDLTAICEEVKNPELANVTPDIRATTLAKNIDARIKSEPIRAAWGAIASAEPRQKYKLLQEAGREAGVERWSCPELESLWTPPPEAEPEPEPEPAGTNNGTNAGGTNAGGTNGEEPMPPG